MNDFPHILRASGHQYRGKRCQLANPEAFQSRSNQVQVRFEDGFLALVGKNHLRRAKGETNLVDENGGSGSKLAASLPHDEGE